MEENKNQSETIEISKDSEKIFNKKDSSINQQKNYNPINNNELLQSVSLFISQN